VRIIRAWTQISMSSLIPAVTITTVQKFANIVRMENSPVYSLLEQQVPLDRFA
jgi:hypothetical protein